MEPIERLKSAKLFICDMDGTVYLGDKVLKGAREFVDKVKAGGRAFLFFTNNASRRKEDYYEKLRRLGFSDCRLMTSGDVTISYLNKYHKDRSVYVLGTRALKESMLAAGVRLVEDDSAEIVVSSFDTELTYAKLCVACDALRKGALFLSTHPDYNCPTETGFIPDSGAIAALLTASTGKTPKYLGKPYPETAEAICGLMGVRPEECVSVGDRLYTDIALAKGAGMLSVLVLSGETKAEDVNKENRPDIILNGVYEIPEIIA